MCVKKKMENVNAESQKTPEKSTSERAYGDQQADARRFRHVDSPASPASGSSKYSEQNGRTTEV